MLTHQSVRPAAGRESSVLPAIVRRCRGLWRNARYRVEYLVAHLRLAWAFARYRLTSDQAAKVLVDLQTLADIHIITSISARAIEGNLRDVYDVPPTLDLVQLARSAAAHVRRKWSSSSDYDAATEWAENLVLEWAEADGTPLREL